MRCIKRNSSFINMDRHFGKFPKIRFFLYNFLNHISFNQGKPLFGTHCSHVPWTPHEKQQIPTFLGWSSRALNASLGDNGVILLLDSLTGLRVDSVLESVIEQWGAYLFLSFSSIYNVDQYVSSTFHIWSQLSHIRWLLKDRLDIWRWGPPLTCRLLIAERTRGIFFVYS